MERVKGTILVVDDNDINRRYVKTVLKSLSQEIVLAESGFEAIELIQKHKPDLILIDIQMPLMDGFECFDKITLELGIKVPILAITAFSDAKDRERFIKYGFNDYITKPVRPEILKGTVKHWLDHFDKPSSQENQEQSDFDLGTINELKRYANPIELNELYKEFIEETKIFNDKLAFLQTRDGFTEILSILHTIKGNAGSLGFTKLSELTSTLEEDIKSDANISLADRLQEIESYSSEIFNNYKTKLNLNL